MQNEINALGGADIKRSYLTIGAGGTFRMTVPEGTPDAVLRKYTMKVDGIDVEKSKWEINKSTLKDVTLVDFATYKGNYGEVLNLNVLINNTPFVIQLKTDSTYGLDFMEKMPSLDLSKPFTLRGYDFEDDKGKNRRGLTVYQDEEKVLSFFYDTEKKEALYGIPSSDGTGMDSKKWRRFFEDKSEFLVNYITANVKGATVKQVLPSEAEDINPEDVPF